MTDQERSLLAMDWIVRTYAPTWLREPGLERLDDEATELELRAAITPWDEVDTLLPALRRALGAARAISETCWLESRGVAWGSAQVAARQAAYKSGQQAFNDATGHPVVEVALELARVAVWLTAGACAGEAIERKLKPTVDWLAKEYPSDHLTKGKS